MERDMYGGEKKVSNFFRNRRKPINEYVQNSSISSEAWATYFQDLYTNANESHLWHRTNNTGNSDFTVDED